MATNEQKMNQIEAQMAINEGNPDFDWEGATTRLNELAAKAQDEGIYRHCQCGSGKYWTECNEQSQYCG